MDFNRHYALEFLLPACAAASADSQDRIAANTGTLQHVQGRLYRFLILSASAE
jgi:hypothetical protein